MRGKTKTMPKKLALILCAAVTCCCVLATTVRSYANDANEIPEGYTPIRTVEDLYGINNDTAGKYILMEDIDLSGTKPGGDWDTGHGWQPIKKFTGVLDGNGYRIKNLTIYDGIDNSNKDEYGIKEMGLFSEIGRDGIVKNLGLTDIDICIEKDRVYDGTGGIAGNMAGGEISSCFVTGEINAPLSSYVGGIVGRDSSYFHTMTDCYADVDVYAQDLVGGIAGFCNSANEPINHCYALGTVKSVKSGSATPVVGNVHFGQNYFLLTNGREEGAVGLTEAQAKLEKCYTGFDFNNTWILDKNSPFPYPQLRNCMQVRTESVELISPPDKITYTEGETMNLSGSRLKINYEDDYSVEVPLEESMISYKIKAGNQTVVINYNGKKEQFKIQVKPKQGTLKVTAKKTKLKVGSSFIFKAAYTGNGAVAFSSSNSSVLRIDRTSGRASAKKAGQAVVTIKAGNEKKSIKVTVVKN